jgi:cell wall-associated NlpC family hydrolase
MKLLLVLALFLITACSSPAPRAYAGNARADSSASSSEITDYAQSLLGVPYKYGGNSPGSGFDCSGFVAHVYRHVSGIALPRNSHDMSRQGRPVGSDKLRPGDLVFFNTSHRKFSHVGIYLGDNNFIHSPSSGGNVRIDELNSIYWRKVYNGARRIND